MNDMQASIDADRGTLLAQGWMTPEVLLELGSANQFILCMDVGAGIAGNACLRYRRWSDGTREIRGGDTAPNGSAVRSISGRARRRAKGVR